ncbi:MAG TPA: CBS domain-containing protein [Burkholderiales bacterium]|nr:CBS domain-containing protein [Burkholderiales bacterium]
MFRDYTPLPLSALNPATTYQQPAQSLPAYQQPAQSLPARLNLESPAQECMTDLKHVCAAIIEPEATLDAANQTMIECGVRLLLVVNRSSLVLGMITAADILGEKPLLFIQEQGIKRQDVLVRDIMTPQHQLEVLKMDDVLRARVGHVIATLKKIGRQHAVAVDVSAADQTQKVRGIFSATQVARQLGVTIQTTEVARTFAEIESILSH